MNAEDQGALRGEQEVTTKNNINEER